MVSVKYPVSNWIAAASTRPMSTATIAITRGLPVESSRRLVTGQPGQSANSAAGRRTTAIARSDRADAGRDEEAAVDRRMPLRSLARGAHRKMPMTAVSTPIAGIEQREDQALVAEGDLAEDQRGDQRDGVRLEQVGGHAGAVADVVADVVGDRRGVAGVVLGDALLDLADQVGADVGGLGEDAAADPHEHREQSGAEAEALEHLRRVLLVDQDDHCGAEQAEADGEHAADATGAEGDAHRAFAPRTFGRPRPRGRCPGRRGPCRGSRPGEKTAPTTKKIERRCRGTRLGRQQESRTGDDDDEDRRAC